MAPLKVWQLQHLSMQAAQRIMASPTEEMLSVFTNTAQNFPSLARSLIRTKVGLLNFTQEGLSMYVIGGLIRHVERQR